MLEETPIRWDLFDIPSDFAENEPVELNFDVQFGTEENKQDQLFELEFAFNTKVPSDNQFGTKRSKGNNFKTT